MNDDFAHEDDPLRLARLAIFCSVFGAAILLGLTMSIIRQHPPVRLTQHNFIRIDLTGFDAAGQGRPLVNLRVQTPSGLECDLPLDSLAHGASPSTEWDRNRYKDLSQYGILATSGLSYFGEVAPNSGMNADGSLIIETPAHGAWRFWIRWCAGGDPSKTVNLTTRISANTVRGVAPRTRTLRYGEIQELHDQAIVVP